MNYDVNIAEIVFVDKGKNEIKEQLQIINSQLIISDEFVMPLLERHKWGKTAHACTISLGASNIAVQISDYTVTDKISFSGFYNMPSRISVFKCEGTNVHIVEQNVDIMQLDCREILIANSQIRELDIGIESHTKHLRQPNETDNQTDGKVYSLKSVDIRTCNIQHARLFVGCENVNIQESNIDILNLHEYPMRETVTDIKKLHIWHYSFIKTLEVYCKIFEFTLSESSISNLVAKAFCYIEKIETNNTDVYDSHNFNENHFGTKDENSWLLIEKSAYHDKNTTLRAKANYQIANLHYKGEKGLNRVIGNIFDFCTGYGYKPAKALIASLSVIVFSALIYTTIEIERIICSSVKIVINCTFFSTLFQKFISNMLLSFAAFVGQSEFNMADGTAFWVATIEYAIGIIIFAMFVNALYVRYKE